MDDLPQDLVNIIYNYKEELEKCQLKIDRTVDLFLQLQGRCDVVQEDLRCCGSTECRRLVRVLECILVEASRIVEHILDTSTVCDLQIKLLETLHTEMLEEVLDSNLNPFFVGIHEVTNESTDYGSGNENVPEVNFPIFSEL